MKNPKEMSTKELNEYMFFHWDTLGKVQKEVNRRLSAGRRAAEAMEKIKILDDTLWTECDLNEFKIKVADILAEYQEGKMNENRIPCDCGCPDAKWWGDTYGRRGYCCEQCWHDQRSGANNPWMGLAENKPKKGEMG